jgi:hypothetical protein
MMRFATIHTASVLTAISMLAARQSRPRLPRREAELRRRRVLVDRER